MSGAPGAGVSDSSGIADATGPIYDVAVVGGGPAGLSAALNLVRARRSVLLIDSNRPRNSATLLAHGFLTRDGVSPLELRKMGREEFLRYEGAEHRMTLVDNVTRGDDGVFDLACAMRGKTSSARARVVVAATGLQETLPEIEGLRSFYGTSFHSCIECDGYDKRDEPLAVIGEHSDLADRALLLTQWSDDLLVLTNGADVVTAEEEGRLGARGIAVDRRAIAAIEGDRSGVTGIRMADGSVVDRRHGFVRPAWSPELGYLGALPGLSFDELGLLDADRLGRTTIAGLYAAGETTAPGPQQLIVAAGNGAAVAATVNRDLVVGLEGLPDAVE